MKTLADLNAAITAESQIPIVADVTAAFNRWTAKAQLLNLLVGSLVAGGVLNAPALSTFAVPINFVPGPNQVSALQFDLALPTGFVFSSATAGPAAIAAGKSISTNMVGSALRVLVFGLNQNLIGQGLLATINLTTDPTVSKKLYSIPLIGIVGSDPAGVSSILSGVSASVTVV